MVSPRHHTLPDHVETALWPCHVCGRPWHTRTAADGRLLPQRTEGSGRFLLALVPAASAPRWEVLAPVPRLASRSCRHQALLGCHRDPPRVPLPGSWPAPGGGGWCTGWSEGDLCRVPRSGLASQGTADQRPEGSGGPCGRQETLCRHANWDGGVGAGRREGGEQEALACPRARREDLGSYPDSFMTCCANTGSASLWNPQRTMSTSADARSL